MIRSLSLLAALLGATGADAMTCRIDPAWSFHLARTAGDRYVVLYGTLSADAALFPRVGGPPPAPVPARFAGHALTAEGFTRDASGPVILQPTCVEDLACGALPPGQPVLAFARETGAGLVIQVDPCPTWLVPSPSVATLELMAACARGEGCAGS